MVPRQVFWLFNKTLKARFAIHERVLILALLNLFSILTSLSSTSFSSSSYSSFPCSRPSCRRVSPACRNGGDVSIRRHLRKHQCVATPIVQKRRVDWYAQVDYHRTASLYTSRTVLATVRSSSFQIFDYYISSEQSTISNTRIWGAFAKYQGSSCIVGAAWFPQKGIPPTKWLGSDPGKAIQTIQTPRI